MEKGLHGSVLGAENQSNAALLLFVKEKRIRLNCSARKLKGSSNVAFVRQKFDIGEEGMKSRIGGARNRSESELFYFNSGMVQ